MKKSLLLLVLFGLFSIISQAQTRGALPGEIYKSTATYIGNDGQHYAVFYSADNGKTLSLQYEHVENQPGVMWIGELIGDATPGVVYNNYFYGTNELWVSFNYGVNWEYIEDHSYPKYAAGFCNGEIYRRSDYNLYRSIDYGETFELLVESLTEPLSDVGNQPGELYGFTGTAGIGFNLYHSTDYGNNYNTIFIDSTVAFWAPGIYPQISRGTQSGELYLVSWWPDYHYKIFHSIDTGYSWTQKFESDYIDIYYWSISYTAGRQAGSFYVSRGRLDPTLNHRLLYIDYSDDYGETFTTYFHELDSLYTSVASIHKPELKLSAVPNPFYGSTTIKFDLPGNWQAPFLNIYNIQGVLIRQYDVRGKRSQQWDGMDNQGIVVSDGVYFFNISYNDLSSRYNKIIFIH